MGGLYFFLTLSHQIIIFSEKSLIIIKPACYIKVYCSGESLLFFFFYIFKFENEWNKKYTYTYEVAPQVQKAKYGV